jgi:hypothetical protein
MRNTDKPSDRWSEQQTARSEFFNAESLEAEDGEKIELTIKSIGHADLKNPDGKTETKVILSFEEDTRDLPLNLTRGRQLAKLFGDRMSGWVGQKIELYTCETQLGPGVRIRGVKNASKAKPSRDPDDDDRDDVREAREPAKKIIPKGRTPEEEDDEDEPEEDIRPGRAAKSRTR